MIENSAPESEIQKELIKLRTMLSKLGLKSRVNKYKDKIIPFRDTGEKQWFTGFVQGISDRQIVSGYRDASGNLTGEYGPGNNVTVAEILKIAINVAKHGKVVHIPEQLVLYRQHSNNVVGANKAIRTRGNIWSFLKNLSSLKKRLLNHYRMVKKHDPNVTFLSVVLEKIASKIAQRFR